MICFQKYKKNQKKIQYAMRAVCESHRMSTGIFVDFVFVNCKYCFPYCFNLFFKGPLMATGVFSLLRNSPPSCFPELKANLTPFFFFSSFSDTRDHHRSPFLGVRRGNPD